MLNSAVKMYMVDNDCIGDLSVCGAFTGDYDGEGSQQVWNALEPYFKVVKDCGNIPNQGGCFPPGVVYKQLNGLDYSMLDDWDYVKVALSDGTLMLVVDVGGNCTESQSRTGNTPLANNCANLYIDINGKKGPNQIGRDLFAWMVTKSGIVYPFGSLDDNVFVSMTGVPDCDPDDSGGNNADPGGGLGCTARIIREGKVNY